MKMYFIHSYDELCHSIEEVKSYMIENQINELDVFVAKRITNDVAFFCKKYHDSFLKGSCGNYCKDYIPKNSKSGCCKFFGYCYENTNQIKKIKI